MRCQPVTASLCLFVATASTALADDSALRAVIQARYAAVKAAMASRDPKAISAVLASNFEGTDITSQTEDQAQLIKEIVALPKDPQKQSTTTVLAATASGNTATVSQRYEMKTVRSGPDGVSHHVALTTLSTDTWTRTNTTATWVLATTTTDQLDYYVDDKLVTHKVRSTTEGNQRRSATD